jgi:hypothetical protein
MCLIGSRHGFCGFKFRHHGFEIEFTRFEMRRVFIGDISGEQFHALISHAQRLVVYA